MNKIFALLLGIVLCLIPIHTLCEEVAEYTGIVGKKMKVHTDASEKSSHHGYVEKDTIVDVYKKNRTWTRIDFEGKTGYVLTKFIERVQRKDPFDGPMPGTSKLVALGQLKKSAYFTPEGFKYPIEMTAGTYLSITKLKDGKAYFPYLRFDEDMRIAEDTMEITPFVDYKDAQPGDLVYAFSTFYSTSTKKTKNVNRQANISLACRRLSGHIIPAGGQFSFNEICGPYTEENAYLEAPILSGESSIGYGGGVCQVNSTIYNIVLRIPTVIIDMHWHGQGGVRYVPAGFDATVGSKWDMIFENILPYDLRLEMQAHDGVLTAIVYRADE